MSTTTILGITKIDGGQNQGGVTANGAIDILDAAAGGLLIKALADANYTLSTLGAPAEWHYAALKFTGTLSTGRNIVVPNNKKQYAVINASGQTLTVKTAAGTGTAIANGKAAIVACDGTNVVRITPDTTP
jgi:hypothetical protein